MQKKTCLFALSKFSFVQIIILVNGSKLCNLFSSLFFLIEP